MSTPHLRDTFSAKNLQRAMMPVLMASLVVFPSLSLAATPKATPTPTLSELQAQAAALAAQAKQEQAAAAQQQALAAQAAQKVRSLATQITSVQTAVGQTTASITATQQQIAQQDQQIANLQSEYGQKENQLDALVRELYIMKESTSDDLKLFANQPISQSSEQAAQLSVLTDTVTAAAKQTQDAESQVQQTRQQLAAQNDALNSLQAQQQLQQQNLSDVQSEQQAFQKNAVAEMQQLNAASAAASAQVSTIQKQITLLTATKSWGTQLVSGADHSFYFTQTGDYTTLGDSSETIANVGCLITADAMVSKYYGHNVTPDYIANNGYFTNDGYLVSLPPIGVTIGPAISISKFGWDAVNNDLLAGRPVIAGVQLYDKNGNLIKINYSNGVWYSHFIVIYAVINGIYQIEDPIAPTGRSYDKSNIAVIREVTNN